MKQKYYIYAGYYELIITEQKIGRPYIYQGFAYSLEGAINRCEKIDDGANIVYSHNLKEELRGLYDWWGEEELAQVGWLKTEDYTLDKLTWRDIQVAAYNYSQYDGRRYECDADGHKIMIDYSFDFDTLELSQEEYEKVEKVFDSVHFTFPQFEVGVGYDVSGYDYWTRIMEEPIRPYICIRSRKDGFIPKEEVVSRYVDKCLERVYSRLDKAGIRY